MAEILVRSQGFDAAGNKADSLNSKFDKTEQIFRTTEKEAKKLAATQRRVLRETETAQEKYNRKLLEGKKALAGHAREKELLARLEEKLQQELRESSAEYQSQKRLLDEAQQSAKKRTEDDKRRINELAKLNETTTERYKRKLRELGELQKRTGMDAKTFEREKIRLKKGYNAQIEKESVKLKNLAPEYGSVKKESAEAFAVTRVTAWGAGLVSVTGLASKLHGQLVSIREEQEAAASAMNATLPTAGALVQLAGADSKKLDSLLSAADVTFSEGNVRSREDAERLIFELESAGRLKDRSFFSRLSVVDDAAALAKSAGLISSGFRGGDDVGSSQDIISKVIAGSLPATGVNASQVAQGTATAAASAKQFDLTDEELIAAVSVVSQETGSGEQAGSNVRRLLTALAREGLADELSGQGLEAILKSVTNRNLSKADTIKLLGSVEAQKAFVSLTQGNVFSERLGDIQEAQSTNLASRTINNALNQTRIRSGVLSRAGEAAVVLSKDSQAVATNAAVSEENFREAKRRNRGDSELFIGWSRWAQETSRAWFGAGDPASTMRSPLPTSPGSGTALDRQVEAFYSPEAVAERKRNTEIAEKQWEEQRRQTEEAKKQTKLLSNLKSSNTVPVE